MHDTLAPEAANVCVTTSTKRNENNGTEAEKENADSKQHTLTTLMEFRKWVGWRVPDRNVFLPGPLRNVGRSVLNVSGIEQCNRWNLQPATSLGVPAGGWGWDVIQMSEKQLSLVGWPNPVWRCGLISSALQSGLTW